MAGVALIKGVSCTCTYKMASKGDSDSEDYHSAEEEQELSDKMSRLTPDNKMENSSKEKADFVGNLDNRYVSEDVEVKGEKIELSEEQIKVR